MVNNTFLNLSEQEMLALWRRVMHLDITRRECSVERDDGIDVDGLLLIHLRQWYAHLLQSAPLEWLPVDDVKTQVVLEASPEGVVTAVLPAQAVRPVEWQLAGWDHSVTEFEDHTSGIARRQRNRWTRGGPSSPVAVKAWNKLWLYSLPPGVSPVLLTARCVVKPDDGRYIFHQAALNTLERWQL